MLSPVRVEATSLEGAGPIPPEGIAVFTGHPFIPEGDFMLEVFYIGIVPTTHL